MMNGMIGEYQIVEVYILVGGLVAIFYFPIYWESSSQLTNIFQRGSNHQPVLPCMQ